MDAADLFRWPLANYDIVDGEIRPVGNAVLSGPLRDPDLFGSFCRLWIEGPPSKAKMRRWVKRFGLFTADIDERPVLQNGLPHGELRGDPVTLEDFREESRLAHDALVVYDALVNHRMKPLRDRIRRERVSPLGGPPGTYAHTYVRFADHEFDAAHFVSADDKLDEETVLSVAVGGLKHLLAFELEGRLRLWFGTDMGTKRPLSAAGRPVPVWVPQDLKTAAWLQFQQEIADARNWRLCAGCGQPFPVRRKGQTCCAGSPNCRKQKERKTG